MENVGMLCETILLIPQRMKGLGFIHPMTISDLAFDEIACTLSELFSERSFELRKFLNIYSQKVWRLYDLCLCENSFWTLIFLPFRRDVSNVYYFCVVFETFVNLMYCRLLRMVEESDKITLEVLANEWMKLHIKCDCHDWAEFWWTRLCEPNWKTISNEHMPRTFSSLRNLPS